MRTQIAEWPGVLLVLAVLGACTSPYEDKRLAHLHTPPDFALEFRVQGPAEAQDPRLQPGLYLLEPDRELRVGGPQSGAERYPPVTAVLEPAEFDALVSFVRQHHLMAEPTSPGAERALADQGEETVLYRVVITGWGRTHRFATTPRESPPTVALLTRLLKLRGIQAAKNKLRPPDQCPPARPAGPQCGRSDAGS